MGLRYENNAISNIVAMCDAEIMGFGELVPSKVKEEALMFLYYLDTYCDVKATKPWHEVRREWLDKAKASK